MEEEKVEKKDLEYRAQTFPFYGSADPRVLENFPSINTISF